jgi:hypothetical protein
MKSAADEQRRHCRGESILEEVSRLVDEEERHTEQQQQLIEATRCKAISYPAEVKRGPTSNVNRQNRIRNAGK